MIDTWARFVPLLLVHSVKWCFRRCDCKEVQWLLQGANSLDRTCSQAAEDLSLYEHWCLQSRHHLGLFWSREAKAQLPTSSQCHHLWKTSNCYWKANCRSGQPRRHLNEVATGDLRALSQEEYQHGYLLKVWSSLSSESDHLYAMRASSKKVLKDSKTARGSYSSATGKWYCWPHLPS